MSLTRSNILSPPDRWCLCPFPSQWRKHKTKPIKILLWQGVFFPLTRMALVSGFVLLREFVYLRTISVSCLVCDCTVGSHSIYLFARSDTPPQTQRLPAAGQTTFLLAVQQPPLQINPQHNGTLYLVQTNKAIVPQEQNLVVLIHPGLPVVSAQRASTLEGMFVQEWVMYGVI